MVTPKDIIDKFGDKLADINTPCKSFKDSMVHILEDDVYTLLTEKHVYRMAKEIDPKFKREQAKKLLKRIEGCWMPQFIDVRDLKLIKEELDNGTEKLSWSKR